LKVESSWAIGVIVIVNGSVHDAKQQVLNFHRYNNVIHEQNISDERRNYQSFIPAGGGGN